MSLPRPRPGTSLVLRMTTRPRTVILSRSFEALTFDCPRPDGQYAATLTIRRWELWWGALLEDAADEGLITVAPARGSGGGVPVRVSRCGWELPWTLAR